MSTESFLQALDIRASIDTCMIRFARPTGREAENNLKSLLEGVTIVDESEGMISLKINPNKVYAEYVLGEKEAVTCYEVHKYSEYQQAIMYVLNYFQVFYFIYKRVDFRFDSYTVGFDEVEKLNKALILTYFTLHYTDNIYHTEHLVTKEDLNDCYKASTREIESYRKIKEEPTGMVLSRLEIRSVNQHRVKNTFPMTRPEELAGKWYGELKECSPAYSKMLGTINHSLLKHYMENRAKYPTANEFMRHNMDFVFTAKQMEELYSSMGVQNPVQARYNFIKRNKGLDTSFYTEKDIEKYICYLIKRLKLFFQN
jgi:hypothetical protein